MEISDAAQYQKCNRTAEISENMYTKDSIGHFSRVSLEPASGKA